MRTHDYFVYIMASHSGTLYIGVTNSVGERAWAHKAGKGSGFTAKYQVERLVYFEQFQMVRNAIAREKQLKGWRRSKKIALIETKNPQWRDLSKDFGQKFKPDKRGPSTPPPYPSGVAQDDKD